MPNKMEARIIHEIMEKHLKADATISLFFIGLDTLFYILILLLIGCGFKNFFSPKQMLSQVLLLDVLLRIFTLYYNKFEYELLNEVVFSCFSTLQFFYLNTILKKMFKDDYYDGRESIEIKHPFLFSLVFLILTFTSNLPKIVSIVQYGVGIVVVMAYAYYIQSRVSLFINNLERKRFDISCKNISLNMTYLVALYFIIFQALKICTLFIEHKLYYSYMLMACDIFKEGGKFLLFGLMMILVNSFNKFIKDEEGDNTIEKEEIY